MYLTYIYIYISEGESDNDEKGSSTSSNVEKQNSGNSEEKAKDDDFVDEKGRFGRYSICCDCSLLRSHMLLLLTENCSVFFALLSNDLD